MAERGPAGVRCGKTPNQFVKASAGLAEAAGDPDLTLLSTLMVEPFVYHSRSLFERALCQRGHLQHLAARGAEGGDEGAVARLGVEIVEDRRAVDQHLAMVKDQGRNAGQGADPADRLGIAEDRPGVAGKGHAVVVECHGDAAGGRAVVLTDEDHLGALFGRCHWNASC
jgi:phage terminase large subunit-like protein